MVAFLCSPHLCDSKQSLHWGVNYAWRVAFCNSFRSAEECNLSAWAFACVQVDCNAPMVVVVVVRVYVVSEYCALVMTSKTYTFCSVVTIVKSCMLSGTIE